MTATIHQVTAAADRRSAWRQEGQALIEYALIISVVAMLGLGGFTMAGGNLRSMLQGISAGAGVLQPTTAGTSTSDTTTSPSTTAAATTSAITTTKTKKKKSH